MTKKEAAEYFERFDRNKYKILDNHMAFEFIVKDKDSGNYAHTGIGFGSDMTEMCLFSLLSLYKSTCDVSIEQYAESVKRLLIQAYQDNLLRMEKL